MKIRNFENVFNLLTGVFGVWGLFMTYYSEIEEYRVKNYNNSKTIMIMKCMTWFRIIYVIIFGVFIMCVGAMMMGVCIITLCKGGDIKQEMKAQMGRRSSVMIAQRVPFLNNIVLNSSMFQLRSFDPNKDISENCGVCSRPFSTADRSQIAELNCANQHIFHVDCI